MQKNMMSIVIKICSTVTNIASSPVLFVLILVWLIILYAFLPIVGYAKWNAGIGLFGNTNGSNFELITGAGAMVMLGLQAKHNKAHKKSLDDLHAKVDRMSDTKK
jgi:hypothetical protein